MGGWKDPDNTPEQEVEYRKHRPKHFEYTEQSREMRNKRKGGSKGVVLRENGM